MKFLILLILFTYTLFANVGKIVSLKGEANITRDNKTFQVKRDTLLKEKDILITKENSKLQILFKDETIISIGKNSTFKINDYLFENKDNVKAEFSMIKGVFRTITGKIGKIAPQNFKLKTKSASIGIRGTQIITQITEGKERIFCTEGQIEVTQNLTNLKIIVNKGEFIAMETNNGNALQKTKTKTKDLKEINENVSVSDNKAEDTVTKKEINTPPPPPVVQATETQTQTAEVQTTVSEIVDTADNSEAAAEQAAEVEAQRIAEEQAAAEAEAEAQRIAEEQAAAVKKLADEIAAAEAQRIADELAAAQEAKRIADELATAEVQALADELAAAEAQRIADELAAAQEAKRIADELAAIESQRLADELAAAEALRLAQEQAAIAEAKRIADELAAAAVQKLIDEAASAAEIQALEEEQSAAEALRLAQEQAAIAEAKIIADELAAAEAQKLADELADAEAQRIADELAAAQEAKRIADELAAAEAQKLADELAAAEAQRIADELAAAQEAKRIADELAAAAAQKLADELAVAEALRLEEEAAAAELAASLEFITPESYFENNTSKATYTGDFNSVPFDDKRQYIKYDGEKDERAIPTDTTISMDIDFGKSDDQITNGKISVTGYTDLEFDGFFKQDSTIKLTATNSTDGAGDANFFGSDANIIKGDIKLENDELKLDGEFLADKYEYEDIDRLTEDTYFINNTSTASYLGNFNNTEYNEDTQYSSSFFNKSKIDEATTISMDIDFGASQNQITNGKIDMISEPDFEFTGNINKNDISLSGGKVYGTGSANFFGSEAELIKGSVNFQNYTNSIKGNFEASKK